MTHSTNRPYPQPSSDEKIIIDHSDGSMRKHRETVSSDDPAMEARLERARLEMDRQLKIRDNDNAARGLLVGVIATTFLGLGILAWYILTNRQNTEVTPTVVPAQPSEPSTPPDINITLPNPPAAERTEIPAAPPTIIQTQPASPQPTNPSSQETVPSSNSEASSPEPTGSSAPSTSEESTESSAPAP
ncbi:hypothetical protein [Acaryochloris sp. IP29b_bin.137]|uniref:hypothetical protein n=1 Tax=Acaryochloris sp. IP29b_bin.137 TaxID=2969217 RepID=UPI00261C6195|nr:hypothetical protein [Acaryochloris sp. IP29b_bin.137]